MLIIVTFFTFIISIYKQHEHNIFVQTQKVDLKVVFEIVISAVLVKQNWEVKYFVWNTVSKSVYKLY